MKSENILITGINGFLGRSLKEYIKKEIGAWRVFGADRVSNKANDTHIFDIRNKKKLRDLLLEIRPSIIFHMAGDTSSWDFKKLIQSHVYLTYVLFEAVKEIGDYTPRIVIPSSASEYGTVDRKDMPITENHIAKPESLYGLTKKMQTDLSLMYKSQGFHILVGRIFNIIGAGTPVNFAIGRFAHELAMIQKGKKKTRIHTKSLDTKRDFLDIRDVCHYLVAVATRGKIGQIYNICRGECLTLRELLSTLIDISGIKNIQIIEEKGSYKRSELKESCGSPEKLRRLMGPHQLISIDRSLENTYSFYLSKM